MNDAPTALPMLSWQTQGEDYEYEHDGSSYTGWCRSVGGRTLDGRWTERNQKTGEERDHRMAFPDGRTEMRADELPLYWLGYVDDNAAIIGIMAFEGHPGFVGEGLAVYAAPSDGCRATLKRLPGDQPSFEFRLPHGENFGGRSVFWVALSRFFS